MAWKGKGFRSSGLCNGDQPVIDSENDEEVEVIISQNKHQSCKTSAPENNCILQNAKQREMNHKNEESNESATKPTNVVGKFIFHHLFNFCFLPTIFC